MVGRIIYTLLLANLISTSCVPIAEDTGLIGDKLSSNSGLVQGSNWSGDFLWFHDTVRARIHRINVRDLTHEFKMDALPGKSQTIVNSIFSPSDGDWAMEMTHKDLRVVSPDGSSTPSPISFQGEPVSVSWDPTTRNIVIYDDLKSVILAKMTEDGDFDSSAILGPILDNQTDVASIRSGDLDDQNRLILALINNEIAIVDFNKTLADGSWSYTSYTPSGITDIDWIAPLKDGENVALLSAKEGIFLIDYENQTIIHQIDFSETSKIIKRSRNLKPHIIYNAGTDTTIVYPDGNLLRSVSKIDLSIFYNIESSVLDLSNDTYTISYSTNQETNDINRISRYRFKDGLVVADQKIPNNVEQLVVGQNYAVSIYKSNLGHIVRTDLASDRQKNLSGFNEPWFAD